jgi:hypothetical protein
MNWRLAALDFVELQQRFAAGVFALSPALGAGLYLTNLCHWTPKTR